jgi:hypothetical protein
VFAIFTAVVTVLEESGSSPFSLFSLLFSLLSLFWKNLEAHPFAVLQQVF